MVYYNVETLSCFLEKFAPDPFRASDYFLFGRRFRCPSLFVPRCIWGNHHTIKIKPAANQIAFTYRGRFSVAVAYVEITRVSWFLCSIDEPSINRCRPGLLPKLCGLCKSNFIRTMRGAPTRTHSFGGVWLTAGMEVLFVHHFCGPACISAAGESCVSWQAVADTREPIASFFSSGSSECESQKLLTTGKMTQIAHIMYMLHIYIYIIIYPYNKYINTHTYMCIYIQIHHAWFMY